jgi:methylphosphotriester-DNA--protein-cysteine methyltransferase
MNVDVHIPSTLLSPFVKTYLIIECEEELVNRVLPDTSLVMVFRYKGLVNYLVNDRKEALPSFTLSGLRRSGRLINYTKGTGNILVIFKEGGATPFIKEPLYELFEESVSLDCCAGYQDLSIIEEELAGATNNRQRIDLVERFLLSRLTNQAAGSRNHFPGSRNHSANPHNHPSDPLIGTALGRIRMAKGVIRIKELADTLYISQDAFEKRFRRVVGVSPKQYSYIIRMRSILHSGLRVQTLTGAAFDAGYFDQPHFNKDFKLFTGLTPTDFVKSPVYW